MNLKRSIRQLTPHPVYRIYRKGRIAHERRGFRDRTVEHMYAGHQLRVELVDPLSAGWYDHDWSEPNDIAFFRERGVLKAGATVFDLGAHHGVVALMIAKSIGQGTVVAVEAERANAEAAMTNVKLNHAEGTVNVIWAAASSDTDTVAFANGLNGHVDIRTKVGNVLTPAVTIDALAAEYGIPDLVYIDVEGYEQQVLEGATTTLRNRRTSFMVEVHETITEYGGSPRQLLELFSEFEVLVAQDESEFRPVGPVEPQPRFFLAAVPVSA